MCILFLFLPLNVHSYSFICRLIEFKHNGNTVINPARANCYCSYLKFRKVSTEVAASPNKFLTYAGRPVLCCSFIIVNTCNLIRPRTYGSRPIYEVKDVQVRFPKYELERLSSFLGFLLQATTIYYNGVSIPLPCINIGVRFNMTEPADGEPFSIFHSHLTNMVDNASNNQRWNSIPNENYPVPPEGVENNENKADVAERILLVNSDTGKCISIN